MNGLFQGRSGGTERAFVTAVLEKLTRVVVHFYHSEWKKQVSSAAPDVAV